MGSRSGNRLWKEGAARRSVLGALLVLASGAAVPGPSLAQPLELRINLPSYRLEVYRGDERIRSYPAAIGMPSHPTPQGTYTLSSITWNPWWNPPNRPWARGEKRTPPGPGNPMGRAKIDFDDLYYIHGSRERLGRAASHGCIRISNEDVLELARLLAAETDTAITAEEISALERSPRRTRTVSLPAGLRIRIVYRLTEEEDGEVRAFEDVYRRGLSSRDRMLLGGVGESPTGLSASSLQIPPGGPS